ncbi:WxL domain-containing protein [Carnobacterium gallinarum]|uniref:WxL domain-containing protein n=1 Tax=Carnobacterium gallinarum TaxID=2749 RepID=UPI00055641E6|nr:WxL domain-containing protein [Carnobacterium gallinarum]
MKLTKVTLFSVAVLGTVVLAATPVHAANTVDTNGKVEFTNGGDTPNPVDPGKELPDEITPEEPAGTTGLLRINQAPTLEFGSVELNGAAVDVNARYTKIKNSTTATETYVPNFLQVNDTRGDIFGWKVTVSGGALTRYDTAGLPVVGSEVENAKITFKNPEVKSNSGVSIVERMPVTQAFELNLSNTAANSEEIFQTSGTDANRGYGIWSANYGAEVAGATVDTRTDDIKLTIPAASSKSAGSYKTALTWTIVTAP